MQYFQILTCNDTLGTCCTDFALATVLDIVRKFFNIFQIIVPILLIIGVTIQLIKLVNDPERKNGIKEITNRVMAALICFFIPVIIDVVLGMVSQTSTFKIADCWELAKISSEISQAGKARYTEGYNDALLVFRSMVHGAPTVEAAPIVRCKHCRHYTATEYTETGFHCGLHSEGCGYVEMNPDDFCCYGEKKEDTAT